MTLTLITETVQALSPDARRALLSYQSVVGAPAPLSVTLATHRELYRVRAVDGLGCLLPFGHMLREAVLDQELDKMDPPAAPTKSVPDVLDLVRQYGIMYAACVGLTDAGAEEPARRHHAEELALFARIEAEVESLRASEALVSQLLDVLGIDDTASLVAEVQRLRDERGWNIAEARRYRQMLDAAGEHDARASLLKVVVQRDEALAEVERSRRDAKLEDGLVESLYAEIDRLKAVLDQELDKMDTPDRGMADPYGDNVRELVAAAKAWVASREERNRWYGDTDLLDRLVRAVEALS